MVALFTEKKRAKINAEKVVAGFRYKLIAADINTATATNKKRYLKIENSNFY